MSELSFVGANWGLHLSEGLMGLVAWKVSDQGRVWISAKVDLWLDSLRGNGCGNAVHPLPGYDII